MASELQHIDDFFRRKNEMLAADSASADLHWQQMKETLGNNLSLPAKNLRPSLLKTVMKYAAVLTIVSSLLYVSITKPWKERVRPQESSLPGNPVVPAITQPAVKVIQPKKSVTPSLVIKHRVKPPAHELLFTPVPAGVYRVDSLDHKDHEETSNARAFINFYNELKKDPEEFIIDTNKDTTINCKEGTSIFIPASCFQSLAGTAVSGPVKLMVQEFYSFSDIVGNKLTTLSGDQTLVTGGMLNIQATAGDQDIMIRPGAAINLAMPSRTFDPAMQLFTGVAGATATKRMLGEDEVLAERIRRDNASSRGDGINWIAAGQQQFFMKENRKYITILNMTDNPYDVVYRGDKTIGKFRIPFDCRLSAEEMKKELEKRYGRYYDKIKVKREWKPLFKKQREEREGAVTEWYESLRVADSITIPLWIARLRNLVSRDDSLKYEAKWRREYEEAKKRNDAYSEFVQVRENYNFRIGNLGWINCDRFSDYPASRLADFTVSTGDEFKSTYFCAMVIMDRQNSAMPGIWYNGMISFSRLPVGEEVNVICVGAKKGKVFSSVQKFTVRKEETNKLEFKETTPGEFRNELARFGSVTRQINR